MLFVGVSNDSNDVIDPPHIVADVGDDVGSSQVLKVPLDTIGGVSITLPLILSPNEYIINVIIKSIIMLKML